MKVRSSGPRHELPTFTVCNILTEYGGGQKRGKGKKKKKHRQDGEAKTGIPGNFVTTFGLDLNVELQA